MKAKLFIFLGLALTAASAATLFFATPTHARGEKYEWINADTIRAKDYSIDGISFKREFDYKRSGTVYKLDGDKETSCKVMFTITPTADNSRGTLDIQTSECEDDIKDLDRNITIAHPERGPKPEGSDVDYATVNCSQQYSGDATKIARCEAVKKCFANDKTSRECLAAWDICIANHGQDGSVSDADKKFCSDNVSAGKLTEAAAIPATSASEDKTTCAITGIGWIICPVVSFLSQIVDASYGFVGQLLAVQPLLTDGSTKGIYEAWSLMRNFANVAFVIAFLIIIFSQVSSIGISNYGIKKMLPRIIIAAILVNLSYWICAVAIDVSNILGTSLNQLLQNVKDGLTLPNADDFGATGTGWAGITGSILAGAGVTVAILYIGLSALLPLLVTVLGVIVTVFITLILRQALIILLVVIAPLAFVAYLLPNTEDLFKKWRTLFQTLLIMYPVISILFGASALASAIIMGTAPDGDYKIPIQIAGASASVLPLVLLVGLIKAYSSILERFGINNINKGPLDRMRKGAEEFRERQEGRRQIRSLGNGRTFSLGKYSRAAKRNAIASGIDSEAKRAQSSYVADQALSNEAFRNRLAGGRTLGANASGEALNRAIAGAVSVQAKIEADEVTAASAVIKSLNLDRNQAAMRTLATGGQVGDLNGGSNRAIRAAAMKNVVDSHDIEGVNTLLDSVGSMDARTRESFADSLLGSKEKPEYVSQSAISNIRQHGEVDANGRTILARSSTELAADAINNNTYSVDKLATGDREELTYIATIAADPTIATNNTQLAQNAKDAITDPIYSGKIGKNTSVVNDISRL